MKIHGTRPGGPGAPPAEAWATAMTATAMTYDAGFDRRSPRDWRSAKRPGMYIGDTRTTDEYDDALRCTIGTFQATPNLIHEPRDSV
jgi:hypothetical protein